MPDFGIAGFFIQNFDKSRFRGGKIDSVFIENRSASYQEAERLM